MLPAGKRAADAGVRRWGWSRRPPEDRPGWRLAARRAGSETMSAVLVPMIRTFDAAEFDAAGLAAAKDGQRISVCLPARNEADTVGPIVDAVRRDLVDGSRWSTRCWSSTTTRPTAPRRWPAAAGATGGRRRRRPARATARATARARRCGSRCSLSDGDMVVWCDADVRDFDPAYVVGLVGPLLTRPELGFVKGFYDRPLRDGQDGGGRVTELVARPVLALLFPQLAPIVQPLAGEYAGRRELLEQLPFVERLRRRHRPAHRRGRALRARRNGPGRPGHPPPPQPPPRRAGSPGHSRAAGRPGPGRAGPDR